MNIEDVPRLKEFCQEMLAWIDGGCGEHDDFCPTVGLCTNYRMLFLANSLEYYLIATMDTVHPFGGVNMYFEESETQTLYQNPQRLAWLKEHAK